MASTDFSTRTKIAQNSYRKVIISGNVIEVYEAEKEPYIPEHKYQDDYDPFHHMDIMNENDFYRDGYTRMINEQNHLEQDRLRELTRVDRQDERRQQTVRDARNNVRRLALMNFGVNDKFITLTYKKNMQDIEQADKDFKTFIKRFKYHFNIKNLKYIAVREFQKRGAVHFHMICDWDKLFTDEKEIRQFERLLGKDIWKHGFVDIKQMDHVDNVGAYIIKYMTKNVSIIFFKGRKIYLCSKGLNRPVVYKGVEAEEIIKKHKLEQKKEVFTNSYISEYLGTIVYKEYNLIRK